MRKGDRDKVSKGSRKYQGERLEIDRKYDFQNIQASKTTKTSSDPRNNFLIFPDFHNFASSKERKTKPRGADQRSRHASPDRVFAPYDDCSFAAFLRRATSRTDSDVEIRFYYCSQASENVNVPPTLRFRRRPANLPPESRDAFRSFADLNSDSTRNVRTNITQDSNHEKRKNGHEESEGSQHEQKQEEPKFGEEGSGPQPPKMDPALARNLRIYSIVVTLASFGLTYLVLKKFMGDEGDHHSLLQPGNVVTIPMNEFLNKYLPSGEVQSITYVISANKAFARLQENALIDGKPVPHSAVIIDYPRVAGQPNSQFMMEVRHAEEEMGITMRDAIPIQVVEGFSGRKLVELLIGLTIIISQYGRLIRRKIMEQRAQAAKGGPKPPRSP
ncbi:hypothetical protein L596_006928 [Steinernema carpocapsae]|uniref:Uncharacterized protein n=2 Tax=Steinernema carpocapsae TaxID=34508 RepID=A0A4U5P7L1_STECR|nr:hypothetical protein L596_006928 [Steinernema carpocapsae]